MAIESMMYFALGFLIASLFALIVLPSVWKRAVRLTKKRIEAATPITMAEFRADKDQLRAEFALTSRRLERNIETLRTRLTEQLGELNTARSDAAIAIAERDRFESIHNELAARHEAATARMHELEREVADLAQQLRGRDRELAELAARTPVQNSAETVEKSPKSAIASIRDALSFSDRDTFDTLDGIDEAYSRITSAGSHLDALLEEAEPESVTPSGAPLSLAEHLSQQDALEDLHSRITNVEISIRRDWENGNADKPALRDQLGDIASAVSHLVYATDSDIAKDTEESLFDRIRKFAGDSLETEALPKATPSNKTTTQAVGGTSVSDRMAAFRNLHANS